MNSRFILGIFKDEQDMVHAAKYLVKKDIKIYDFFTPFPVHGLDEILGIKRTRLPIVTFIAGLAGLVFALGFQYWVSVIAWPLNVGGKAYNSMAAFIPVAFEITVLFGAFITIFAFLLRSKLFPKVDKGVIYNDATQDSFVIALEYNIANLEPKILEKIFEQFNVHSVLVKEVEL